MSQKPIDLGDPEQAIDIDLELDVRAESTAAAEGKVFFVIYKLEPNAPAWFVQHWSFGFEFALAQANELLARMASTIYHIKVVAREPGKLQEIDKVPAEDLHYEWRRGTTLSLNAQPQKVLPC